MAEMMFKTGEFAKLCNTSKDTLIYYDKISLLKPALKDENGYRYYSVHQLYSFDIIEALKEVGTPLNQIKEYIKKRNSASFKDILNEKLADLDKELKRLSMMKKVLINTISSIELSQNVPKNKVFLKYNEEEYLITTDKLSENLGNADYYRIFRELIDYCYYNGYSDNFMIGEILSVSDAENSTFRETYLFSPTHKKVNSKYLHIKPAGDYLTMYFYGSYDDLPDAYKYILDFSKKNGYTPIGNIYEKDILNYMCVEDDNSYLMEISMPVKYDK